MKYPKPVMFVPKNPKKYIGDVNNIIARSNLEKRVFKYLDENDDIINYSSEEIHIPYYSPLDDKMHRYFVDLIVKTKTGKLFFVEIKPDSQTREPKQTKNKKRYLNEMSTWIVNDAKWKAARQFAKEKGGEFIIITEKDLRHN